MLQLLKRTVSAYFGLMSRVGTAVCAMIVSLNAHNKMNCMNLHAVHLPQTIQLRKTLSGLWKMPVKPLNIFVFLSALLLSFNALAVTPPGTLIINTASADRGGSIQVALSFLEECKGISEHQYFVFLSPNLQKEQVLLN